MSCYRSIGTDRVARRVDMACGGTAEELDRMYVPRWERARDGVVEDEVNRVW